MTDNELKVEGIKCLLDELGALETARSISLVIKEPIDYTEWRRNMYGGMSVRELSAKAMEYHREIHK